MQLNAEIMAIMLGFQQNSLILFLKEGAFKKSPRYPNWYLGLAHRCSEEI